MQSGAGHQVSQKHGRGKAVLQIPYLRKMGQNPDLVFLYSMQTFSDRSQVPMYTMHYFPIFSKLD
jgi:hypothetical protein